METAKVDMRRLQLLNDRISQVMDALNQVRFSVHGLQHSQANVPFAHNQTNLPFAHNQTNVPFAPWQQQQQPPMGFGYPQQLGYPVQNIAPQAWLNQAPGLGHTGYENLDPTNAWRLGGIDPFGGQRIDPFTAQRLAQTFPYAYSTVSPASMG